jgi:hypothetical protein
MLKWTTLDRKPQGCWLRCTWNESGVPLEVDPRLKEIQQWSQANSCGVRMSYDMWQFKTPAEVTAFLLRWT